MAFLFDSGGIALVAVVDAALDRAEVAFARGQGHHVGRLQHAVVLGRHGALADQGGIAIEHARLLERIRNNSRLFLKLASSVNSSLNIKDVLHTPTEEMVEALDMKGATIRLLNKESDELELVDSYGLSERFLR